MEKIKTKYIQQSGSLARQVNVLNNKLAFNSFYRLLSFMAIIVAIVLLVKYSNNLWLIPVSLFLILFLYLLKRHVRLLDKQRVYKAKSYVVERELKYHQGDYSLLERGDNFLDSSHVYAVDLDIFGKHSLFQVINRTFLPGADVVLAHKLLNAEYDKQKIQSYSEAFHELAGLKNFREEFMALARIIRLSSTNTGVVNQWFKNDKNVQLNLFKVLPFLMTGVSLITMILLVIGLLPFSALWLVLGTGLIITSFNLKFINNLHTRLSKSGNIMFNYSRLLALVEQTKFNTPELTDFKQGFYLKNSSPQKVLYQLSKLIQAFDSRLNILVSIILNGFFLWDYYLVYRLLKWKHTYENKIPEWFQLLNRLDVYVSMGTFIYNHPAFCKAKILKDDNFNLYAETLAHPLIPGSVRVDNNFNMQSNDIILLTGANMSGKSTFLRIIGINMVLAMNGLPVCAKRFEFVPVKIFSSMRTTDSLDKNESYFYAELSRLRLLTELINRGEPVFFLLDEILKGTNSEDKRKGSMLYIEKLIQSKVPGILATHDISLTQMQEKHPDIIQNYCFEIEIEEEEIKFDYKLRQGVTQNMNALKLMRQYKLL